MRAATALYIDSIENVTGSACHDDLWGNDGANVLDGRDGNDTLKGFGGADVLYGHTGDEPTHDIITLSAGRRSTQATSCSCNFNT